MPKRVVVNVLFLSQLCSQCSSESLCILNSPPPLPQVPSNKRRRVSFSFHSETAASKRLSSSFSLDVRTATPPPRPPETPPTPTPAADLSNILSALVIMSICCVANLRGRVSPRALGWVHRRMSKQ